MNTIVITPNGTVTVMGPNTATPNPAPANPAPAAPTPTPAPANPTPAAPTPTPAPANPAPAAPTPTPAPANPAPAGNNAGQGQGGVIIINPNNPNNQTPTQQPAPVAGPTFVAQQTVGGGNRYFPNWVIYIIIFILLLLLACGGYIIYQSGKDAAPAKTETPVLTIVNPGGSKNAVDPKAMEMAQEAQDGVKTNSQRISVLEEDKQKAEFEAEQTKEKNKKGNNCLDNVAQEIFL